MKDTPPPYQGDLDEWLLVLANWLQEHGYPAQTVLSVKRARDDANGRQREINDLKSEVLMAGLMTRLRESACVTPNLATKDQ